MTTWLLYGGSEEEARYSTGGVEFFGGTMPIDVAVELDARPDAALRDIDRMLRYDARPDLVVLACVGGWTENGTLQLALEQRGLPYTGSGVMASLMCMDKARTRARLRQMGLRVAAGGVTTWGALIDERHAHDVVVKPVDGGSSHGIMHLRAGTSARENINSGLVSPRVLHDAAKNERVLVEQYVEGMEVSVAMLDNVALNVAEIEVDGILTEDRKYAAARVAHVPARLSRARLSTVVADARHAGIVCGCRGAYRVDMRVGRDGAPTILEINTLPVMREAGLYVRCLDASHISREQFAEYVRRNANPAT